MKFTILIALLLLSGCAKLGVSGVMSQAVGDWAQIRLPQGCIAQQIAAEEHGGVAILCKDGRIFH
jgi:hypothetical protein